MAQQDFIKFDPEKILEVSITLEQQHKRFLACITSIKKKSENLTDSWHSDSAALYADKSNALHVRGEEMGKVLLEFSQDLASVSGIYKSGEADAKTKAESLPTDGVFLV